MRLGAQVKLDGNWLGDDEYGLRTKAFLSDCQIDTSRLPLRKDYKGVQEVVKRPHVAWIGKRLAQHLLETRRQEGKAEKNAQVDDEQIGPSLGAQVLEQGWQRPGKLTQAKPVALQAAGLGHEVGHLLQLP